MSSRKPASRNRPPADVIPSNAEDAVALLEADHLHVARLFADFAKLKDSDEDERKMQLVREICRELTVHTQIEEEMFYPALRKAIEDDDLMDEALVEHAGAKELIAQLQQADPEDDLFDAKVTVLGEQIDHHVQEEEKDMFLQARRSTVDLILLGERLQARKQELLTGFHNPIKTPLAARPKPAAPARKKR